MKKLFYSLLAGVTMLASCQKDADLAMDGDGGMVDVTVTAAMEGTSATTRATDSYGTGTTVDRCIMEVYIGDDLYKRMVAVPTDVGTDNDVTFNLRLVADKTYDFLFWADKDDTDSDTDGEGVSYDGEDPAVGGGDKHYTTTNGLKAVTASYTAYAGNDETRDAFFGQLASQTITSSVSLPVTLKRPFGQLNVSTALTDVPSDMYPAEVQVTYSTAVCTTLNALTGETDDKLREAITWDAAVYSVDWDQENDSYSYTSGKDMHLSTDYIFAPYYDTEADPVVVKQQLVDFEMTFIRADGIKITTNDNFKSIPIQRNYRTNVSGELLTKQGTINVTINPTFLTPDNSASIKDVATLAALQEAMDEDTTEVEASYSVTDEVVGGTGGTASIEIPALDNSLSSTTETTSRSIELIGGIANGTTLTISAAGTTTTTAPDVVYITLPEVSADTETGNLVIDLPYSTVYINGTCYGLSAATYTNTLVINEGAKVDGLTINKGNVDVYGTLTGEVSLGSYDGTTNASATITVYTATANVTGMTIDTDDVDNITVIYTNPSYPIQNTTSGNSYEDLEEAVAAAVAGDTITLAAGTYTVDNTTTPYDANDTTLKYSNSHYNAYNLIIPVEGLTIIGIGEVIIDSKAIESNGGNYAKQNLITVIADDVKLENLTIYANDNHLYYEGDTHRPNKTLELPRAYTGLEITGCTFLGLGGSKTSGAGRLYLGGSNTEDITTTTATIKNSTFYCGGVSAHSGEVSVDNCTFNGIYFNYEYDTTDTTLYEGDGYYCAWARRGADMTITNSTFSNVEETHMETDTYGNSMIYAPIMASGDTEAATNPYTATTVTATGCTLPSNSGNYGYVTAANSLTINGDTYLPAIYNEDLKKGYDTIKEAVAAAASGNTISLAAGVYDLTPETSSPLLNIDKSLTIKAASGLSASDVIIAPTYTDSSGSKYNQSTIYINYDDNFSSNIEVTFENLTLSSHIYTASSSYANKVVEARGDATLNMNYCIVTPNTYVSEYDVNYAGSVYGHGDASVNLNYCELINSSLTADNIDTSTFNIKNTTFNNSFAGTTSWDSDFIPQKSEFVMNIDNCEFVNWQKGYSGTVSDNLLVRAAYGAIIITDTTFPTEDTSLYCSVLESPSYSAEKETSTPIWGGLIEANGDIYTPTIYNYTQRQVYGDFDDLISEIAANNEIYLGAGTYTKTFGANFKKGVKIYGANKGISGNSDSRNAETIFEPSNSNQGAIYIAHSGSASSYCGITFDGVKFTGDSGTNPYFSIEGGDEIVIKNSIIAVTVPTESSTPSTHSGRVMFSAQKEKESIITLENNLFDPIDSQQQRIVLNSSSNNIPYTCVFDGNVFNNTHINAAVYDTGSTHQITNNQFNESSPQAIVTNGGYSKYTITGNTFNDLPLALKSYWGDLSEEQQSTFGAENTFNNVTTQYEKYVQ